MKQQINNNSGINEAKFGFSYLGKYIETNLGNKELEQQCKKQKEVIDNVKNWIYIVQNNKDNNHLEAIISTDELDDLLNILNEVEK